MGKCEGCGKQATRGDIDRVPLCDGCYYETAADSLRAQLAESAAREVQYRAGLAEAWRIVQNSGLPTYGHTGDAACQCAPCIWRRMRPERALAAPPSTAAAELVNLRELETLARDYFNNAATIDVGMAIIRKLAAVAAARAGTLVPAGGERGG